MRKEVKQKMMRFIEVEANMFGWSVYYDKKCLDKESVNIEFTTRKYTDMDVSIELELVFQNPGSISSNLKDYIENYDVDYEAYLWIGEDGHGQNGAPYHIKDIVDQQERKLNTISELPKVFCILDRLDLEEEERILNERDAYGSFLTEEDKEYLKSLGYLDEDMSQIEEGAFVTVYRRFTKRACIKISKEEAIRILGRKEFLSCLGRSAFHWRSISSGEGGIVVDFNSHSLFM